MENEDVPKQGEQLEDKNETTYPVRLRQPVFSFLTERLRPIYQQTLNEVQEEGSYQYLLDFHRTSRISRLMNRMLDQFPSPEELPKAPILDLSEKDVRLLKETIPTPEDPAGRLTKNEIMDELNDNFRDARFKAKVKSITDGIRSKFSKKN